MNEKIFSAYQECINNIEDYLEYPWLHDDKGKIHETIMNFIDELAEKIKNNK